MPYNCIDCKVFVPDSVASCGYCDACYAKPHTNVDKPANTKSESIAEEAQRLIGGEKRDSYGSAQQSFERIAAVWNALLNTKLHTAITAKDVALLMAGFKLCREAHAPKRDNRVDAIAYLLLEDQLLSSPTLDVKS